MTAEDALGYEGYNARWNKRLSHWVPPRDFVNPAEGLLYMNSFPDSHRFTLMYYYAIVGLGISELGPNSEAQMLFCLTMIMSTIIFTNVFGRVISISNALIQKELEWQAEIS